MGKWRHTIYIYIRIRKSWDNIYRADKRDISAGGSSRFAAYIVIISLLISRGPDPPIAPLPTLTQPCPSHHNTPYLFPPSTGFEQCIGSPPTIIKSNTSPPHTHSFQKGKIAESFSPSSLGSENFVDVAAKQLIFRLLWRSMSYSSS